MFYKKILISVDDGPTAEKVALKGFHLGQQLKAELALLSVINTSLLITPDGISASEMAEVLNKDFQKCHQMLTDNIFKNHKVWKFIEKGKPVEMILKIAEEWDADMIVIGTHGRTGINHLLVGSYAESLLHKSKIPVTVIPCK